MTNAKSLSLLILLNIQDYQAKLTHKGNDRVLNRVIIGRSTLLSMSGRKHLTPEFMQQVHVQMQDFGWFMFADGNQSEVVLRMDAINNWCKIGARPRVDDSDYAKVISGESELDEEAILASVADLIN